MNSSKSLKKIKRSHWVIKGKKEEVTRQIRSEKWDRDRCRGSKKNHKQYLVNFSANHVHSLARVNDSVRTHDSPKLDTRRTVTENLNK
jgi:hypothetical protein